MQLLLDNGVGAEAALKSLPVATVHDKCHKFLWQQESAFNQESPTTDPAETNVFEGLPHHDKLLPTDSEDINVIESLSQHELSAPDSADINVVIGLSHHNELSPGSTEINVIEGLPQHDDLLVSDSAEIIVTECLPHHDEVTPSDLAEISVVEGLPCHGELSPDSAEITVTGGLPQREHSTTTTDSADVNVIIGLPHHNELSPDSTEINVIEGLPQHDEVTPSDSAEISVVEGLPRHGELSPDSAEIIVTECLPHHDDVPPSDSAEISVIEGSRHHDELSPDSAEVIVTEALPRHDKLRPTDSAEISVIEGLPHELLETGSLVAIAEGLLEIVLRDEIHDEMQLDYCGTAYGSAGRTPNIDNPLLHVPVLSAAVSDGLAEHNYAIMCDVSTECNVATEETVGLDEAPEVDAVENRRGRKRKAVPHAWKRNIRKRNHVEGKAYVGVRGNLVDCKSPKNVNCSSCKFNCEQKFSFANRQHICQQFYALGSWERQMDFICHCVTTASVEESKCATKHQRKHQSLRYNLMLDDNLQRVCKSFFCNTLSISGKKVSRALSEKNTSGAFTGSDKRIGKAPVNKVGEDVLHTVRRHIDEFPRIEPHYCRADTTMQYLSPELNLTKLYDLYVNDFCIRNGVDSPVTKSKYRDIFVNEYRLKCFVPKKDQCSVCNAYYTGDAEYKESVQTSWDEHKRREKEAMTVKAADKQHSVDNNNFAAITFDLQAVLYTPHARDGPIYYKRKLAVYNFTVYDGLKNGHCFLWDETEGKRGAVEIASALIRFFETLPENVTHVSTFSDTCGGQNRNRFIVAAMLYVVQKLGISVIDVKYMESGHSYLEVDSIHATIEHARKHQAIYTPKEWEILIRSCRRKPKPYSVTTMKHTDFVDVKLLATQIMKNTTKTTSGERVHWMNIKWLRFEKEEPNIVKFAYSVNADEFCILDVTGGTTPVAWQCVCLVPAYTARQSISLAKKKDLLSLLSTRIIPPDYEQFYTNLPASAEHTDRLPEPSTDEEVQTVSESDAAAEVQDVDVVEAGEIGTAVGTSRQQSADNWTDGGPAGDSSVPVRKLRASRQRSAKKRKEVVDKTSPVPVKKLRASRQLSAEKRKEVADKTSPDPGGRRRTSRQHSADNGEDKTIPVPVRKLHISRQRTAEKRKEVVDKTSPDPRGRRRTSRQQSADNWTDGGDKTSPVRKRHASRQKKQKGQFCETTAIDTLLVR